MRRSVRMLPVLVLPAVAIAMSATSQAASAPTYRGYMVGSSAGEPSIGFDPHLNVAMYTSGTTTTRMWWSHDGTLHVKKVDASNNYTSLDAIGFIDQKTHRTFSSQLLTACSLMAYSDDAGATWHDSEGCGPDVLLDHQSVGGGPYRIENKPVTASASTYPDAVYYCAQNSYSGTCARSDDGGLTFLPGVPAYNTPANNGTDPYGGACSALHGHIRVAPDGVVYLPLKGCGGAPTVANLTNTEFWGGQPSVSVSLDNGQTWTVHKIPGGHNKDESDPSIAPDKANTVYEGWEDGTNPSATGYGTTSEAKIAVSRDHGVTWSKPYDVSSALGIHNVQFPEVIAGDPGRAAFAFLGTKAKGDDQHNGFKGSWDLYIATTTDGGKTWRTIDTTPHDPVERGCIDMQGTSNKTVQDNNICSQRNLLDFNDITVDAQGRVLVAYSDGCTGACVDDPNSKSKGAVDMVMRQMSGPLLYAKGSYAK